MLQIDDHPRLDLRSFITTFPKPLEQFPPVEAIVGLLSSTAEAPLQTDEAVQKAVRELLRHGGFKPTGRSKPASEYLLRAASERALQPINLAVDVCNAVSLHSGLPISVVDLDLAHPPLRVGIAESGTRYVFNTAGQEIDLGGLLCLFDAHGPCGSPVKDSQRTKTHGSTTRTLTIIWGTNALPGSAVATEQWYTELLERQGAAVERVQP